MSKTMFEYIGPPRDGDWSKEIHALAAKQVEIINSNREAYLGAWIAETGLKPSECELCYTTESKDGAIVFRCWVRRREGIAK